MASTLPTPLEMQTLAAYLPRLYAEGFEPVVKWYGGEKGADGVYSIPYPEYHPLVEEFYRQVSGGGWLDYGYNPDEAAKMLKDPDFIRSASLPQIQSMLTFCVRGERFSDGHRAEMIQAGHIRRILERINALLEDEYTA